jgi:hypothetical protein
MELMQKSSNYMIGIQKKGREKGGARKEIQKCKGSVRWRHPTAFSP